MLNGFEARSKTLHRFYNVSIATAIIMATLPLFLLITIALLITQGRPVFYRGARIGEGSRVFHILKFRTLDSARAAELTRDRTLPEGTGIETPLGSFLRETRFDELPQMINVLRGDMNICGPRPVRPEIAAVNELTIPGYSERFRVKPGLIGPTQAYMNHGTSKAVRARFNRILCRAPVHYRGEIGVILVVGACLLARTASRVWQRVALAAGRLAAAPEWRQAAGLSVSFKPDGGEVRRVLRIDCNRIVLESAGGESPLAKGRLILLLPDGQRRFAAIALQPIDFPAPQDEDAFLYKPQSEFAEHVLTRYLFEKVVVPHRSQFLFAKLRRRLARRKTQRSGKTTGYLHPPTELQT